MLTRRTFIRLTGASGLAITGAEFLARTAARAAPATRPHGSNGIEHVVILMMENRSFDHLLSWLPGADGRHDMIYQATDGHFYPNYPLAPDFQGCGYSDPDHSWEGFLVQHNFGKMDGFLQRPTAPADNPGVTLAKANTFPIGYYANRHQDGTRKPIPDLPVIGALAENYTVLDRYFCSFAGETFPNRFYQHAARTDRDHNTETISTLPTIWDQLSPIPNTQGIPTGGYFFRDLPFQRCGGPSTSRSGIRSPLATSTRSESPSPPRRSSTPWRRGICPTSASSTPPSTRRGTEPPPTTTRWPTSASVSGSSPTPTTRSPAPGTSTRPSSS
jgi:phospholipase C